MVGHSDTVRCVQMVKDKQIVISGSYDESLKIWYGFLSYCLSTMLLTFPNEISGAFQVESV
jgi:hypothetical protein